MQVSVNRDAILMPGIIAGHGCVSLHQQQGVGYHSNRLLSASLGHSLGREVVDRPKLIACTTHPTPLLIRHLLFRPV